jgi:microcystin-dependent protein
VSEPFLASIVLFAGNFAPRGWAFCNGQILSIAQNTALFSLLGTTYGGNGQTTFALPDLRGRAPLSPGQGPGLASYSLGEVGGVESVTLLSTQMPAHTHAQPAANGQQTTNRPNGAVPARGGVYADSGDGAALDPTSSAGGSQPHENRSPYLALNYIIALEGIYPSRN